MARRLPAPPPTPLLVPPGWTASARSAPPGPTHTACAPATGSATAAAHSAGDSQGAAELELALPRVLEHSTLAGAHSEQTLLRMTETVHRFRQRLAATTCRSFAEVRPADVVGFVDAPTRHGALPELATRHARRTAVRTLYRTLRGLQVVQVDPTLDVPLLPRGQRAARPLTDDEIVLCRASAQVGTGARSPMRAVAWALGETGAVSSEITQVRLADLDDPAAPQSVRLPGTRRHDGRTAALTAWGSAVIPRRARQLRATPATAPRPSRWAPRRRGGRARGRAGAPPAASASAPTSSAPCPPSSGWRFGAARVWWYRPGLRSPVVALPPAQVARARPLRQSPRGTRR